MVLARRSTRDATNCHLSVGELPHALTRCRFTAYCCIHPGQFAELCADLGAGVPINRPENPRDLARVFERKTTDCDPICDDPPLRSHRHLDNTGNSRLPRTRRRGTSSIIVTSANDGHVPHGGDTARSDKRAKMRIVLRASLTFRSQFRMSFSVITDRACDTRPDLLFSYLQRDSRSRTTVTEI